MRVIAGTAKHLKLKTVEGMNTRPTTDRIKETLFNMISFQVERCRFLDLFSGSGAIGIEALSRGAREAVFVEQNRKAASCIRDRGRHFPSFLWTRLTGSFWRRRHFCFCQIPLSVTRRRRSLWRRILRQTFPIWRRQSSGSCGRRNIRPTSTFLSKRNGLWMRDGASL